MKYKDIDQQLTYLMDIPDSEKRLELMLHFFRNLKKKDLRKLIKQERIAVDTALANYYSLLVSETNQQKPLF